MELISRRRKYFTRGILVTLTLALLTWYLWPATSPQPPEVEASQARYYAPDAPGFEPLPMSNLISSWRAGHIPFQQSFEDYIDSSPNRARGSRRDIIYVQPYGDFTSPAAPSLEDLASISERMLMLEVKVLPTRPIKGQGFTGRSFEDGRRQLLTTSVTAKLAEELPEDAYCLIAVTMTDLYPAPDWSFVFGQAALKARVGVYSFARFDPGEDVEVGQRKRLIFERAAKTMVHEIGHMFGMHHCRHRLCLMNGSNSLPEADSQPLHFCPVCLRKLRWSVEFQAEDRYRKLGEFYSKHQMKEQAVWVERRLE